MGIENKEKDFENFLEERLKILYKNLERGFNGRYSYPECIAHKEGNKILGRYSILWNEYRVLLEKFYEMHPNLKEKKLLEEHVKIRDNNNYSFIDEGYDEDKWWTKEPWSRKFRR